MVLTAGPMHPTRNPGFMHGRALSTGRHHWLTTRCDDCEPHTGQALGQAVQHIQGRKQEYRCVEVKYAEQVCPEHAVEPSTQGPS